MRIFHVAVDRFTELDALPVTLPATGFLWIGLARRVFEQRLTEVQGLLHGWTGGALVDLHVSDLLNDQLTSQYDYTSWYDLVVFRRLAAGSTALDDAPGSEALALAAIDTSPVGFAVFDRVLLTVHSNECAVREFFAQRLTSQAAGVEARGTARLPSSPADLMLRMVNHMVDSYLDLRRQLTRRLGLLQQQLLDPESHFRDWQMVLGSRNALHLLEDTCEDQRSALQEWIDALDEWPTESEPHARRERELLRVRSRDVLEHVERVLSHVRRVGESVEAAVQMHFSALGNRTNDIMRVLTVLTAIFLPLNLITGFFGMNFDSLPLIHSTTGVLVIFGLMVALGLGLVAFFWRQRFIDRD
ncbi:MAG: magnesium transporter CorA family protein [Rubrivivax sp.]